MLAAMARPPPEVLKSGAAHREYLKQFLARGFKALAELERLDLMQAELDASLSGEATAARLPGLGHERSAKLLAACVAEPSLLSAVYWVVCAGALLGEPLAPELAECTLRFVLDCWRTEGGFAPHPQHELGLLSTLSAVQLLLLMGRSELLGPDGACPGEVVLGYVHSLRLPDGSFRGRRAEASEGDCRFVYAALNAMELLRGPAVAAEERSELRQTADWLLRCQNPDGGFGCRPDGACESHAGHTFCCLAGLTLAGGLQRLGIRERKRLVRWLCDRQCAGGGLNGRPGKAPDACYTWWTLASTELLRAGIAEGGGPVPALADLYALAELRKFVASCACHTGGVAAHPGDDPDPFHTFFGLAGLSLLEAAAGGEDGAARWLGRISPLWALPVGLVPVR